MKETLKSLRKLKKYIRKHWNHAKYMQFFSNNERLSLRLQAAENGMEFTPNEVDELIDIITIVQDNMT